MLISPLYSTILPPLTALFSTPKRVQLLCHANPDGDALGALLGLGLSLQASGHNVSYGCVDPVPEYLSFLPESEQIVQDIDLSQTEVLVFLDCGDKHLTKFHTDHPTLFEGEYTVVNIDHHASNDEWGHINVVDTGAASTTEILFTLLSELDMPISPDTATCLLTGIYTDTGGFMHQNSTPEAFQIASKLLALGADISAIAENIFHTYEYKSLQLWGHVLQNLHVTDDGAAIVGVNEEEYQRFGCTRNDLAGVIDIINSLEEVDYSVLLTEDGKGNVKASLRTRKDNVDVNALAKKYGGGGHTKASGFTIPKGKLKKEIRWRVVPDDA